MPKRFKRRVAPALAALLLLAACMTPALPPGPPAVQANRAAPGSPIDTLTNTPAVLLWGEVHDNAAQHALRRDALARLLARGARPVLLMEHFDREQQPTIDRLLAAAEPPTAQALIDAAGGPGWSWPLISPLLDLALQHRLPIVAANVARTDTRRIIREGLAPLGFDASVPADLLAAQTTLIEASHCGLLPAGLAPRMALAQVARDQFMAQQLQHALTRSIASAVSPATSAVPPRVLLLAGNGHVRSDIGVPRWLGAATRVQTLSVGLLEDRGDESRSFDRAITTAAQPRPDPCAAMQAPAPPR
ncbi:MAG: ChaN family lipoprotein [Rubrivivax sp.]|nr:ChaN family lipoprotein [Rubrivivax sp.]